MLGIFGKLLDSNEREIKKLKPIVDAINALEKKVSKLTDKELQGKLAGFRLQHERGKSLDELLPEAFAAVREASSRTIKQRHFDVQMMAAVVLHQGRIAEQKTGEGKTLSSTPALFLNAVAGKGVHLVTVNDYLAQRDCGWMGPIFYALGATCATIVHEAAFVYDPKYKDLSHDDKRLQHLRPVSRKEAYQADITYGTNNEFGFDYLRDNMAFRLEDQVQRGHYFAVVDEVDSILIDEARTPLIISQPAQEATDKYSKFVELINSLLPSDFVVDEKLRTAHMTENGILKIEKMLGVDNLYEKDFSTLHHLEQALKAKTLFEKDKDYVVKDGEIIIVDEFTGRLMMGRRYSEGLHQAIEAKEGVAIQQESQTLATISFQNYFRMYVKLSGMTGTAATEAEEFNKIYKLEVVVIPTNNPMIRVDHADTIYKTISAKYTAVAGLVEELHKKGQPVLIGTTSIEKNEFLSELLKRKGVSHALLNAKNHEKEAEIISHAGEKGAVTVATNMAGRGVDIVLSKGITELGGLFVIGTERHESRRIDNQLRGRSGRQGDPGESRFFVSLEDDLMRIFGGDQVSRVMDFLKMPEDTPIEHGLVSKAIEGAQKKVEGHNFDIRKNTVEYDDVMNQQRQIIYGVRKRVLEAAQKKDTSLKEEILEKVAGEIKNLVIIHSEEGLDVGKIVEEFSTIAPIDDQSKKDIESKISTLSDPSQISEFLTGLARNFYEQRENQVGIDVARQMEVFVYLNTIDTLWIEHLDTMDDLRSGIGLRGYAQRDPLIEYKREGFDLFEKLMVEVDYEIVHRIYKVALQQQAPLVQKEAVEEKHPEIEIGVETEKKEVKTGKAEEGGVTKVTIERGGQVIAQETYGGQGQLTKTHGKIGRNDPCYCGSGKKYKKCHYPN
ncbi:TPA: preprotein translocase subunit SecA [Candidatus Daviesbacteria bacterium]|nr:MAG: Protein translocase subunit SecA [Candidatus Daviesbacteria bacterium GW2011_GWA2_38_17]OGE27256.1 MAG: preprotein translocase subunit SecA [Candidatus Daviesbacteria bacterium RIFCSPHIGHO2_02_FULL_39_41]OGE29374.1 MAG: preprotein translocase subunit SecA [Candidatus Daviesbacteria bacterium RIFCSPHIGHO2_01_FULL_38_8b]OGE44982.1 MAG: preprotein translocase subunit SecA [Candidatus Daviesbacteria bacterium RIFCSPHIGHO2_12_FULL_38_25]OGE68454.1 MAG: preprotein translocase subunit SecA [Ca